MLIELHMIQNFAPSNLNRDDTGAPKDCEFGGVRRARISSQCIKRSIREAFDKQSLLSPEEMAVRTKIVPERVLEEMGTDFEKEEAKKVIEIALESIGLEVKEDGKTEYLIYLGNDAIKKISKICRENWEELSKSVQARDKKSSGKKGKKSAKEFVSKEIRNDVLEILDGSKAADLALFGRMLADIAANNIDASSQVAHAISTNKVSMEFDFYTAVDDLQPREETGAGMMGTVEFNSACFYRYSNIDLSQLVENLGGDEKLARKTVEAFIRASAMAIPTGKQNSFAAQNPPSFIMAVVREKGGPVNLANAFECPVRKGKDDGLVIPSIQALDSYWKNFTDMYGEYGVKVKAASRLGDKPKLEGLKIKPVSLDKLLKTVMDNISFAKGV